MATIFTQAIRRTLSQPSLHTISLPPTFLLPFRARLSTTITSTNLNSPESSFQSTSLPPPHTEQTPRSTPRSMPSVSSSSASTTPKSLTLLPLLAAQPPHYIVAHLHSRPYLLTIGDVLRLPFHMPSAPAGTLLRLTCASALGSRDYTYRGKPWVDERYFVCRVRVVGVEGEPMRVLEKTKRRQRHVKTVRSKMRFTVVRCVELRVRPDMEEEAEDQRGGGEAGVEELQR